VRWNHACRRKERGLAPWHSEKTGHSSVLARNGKEAVALAFDPKFDLAFMDVQMREIDGLAATEAIRQREKNGDTHLPIFAMTP
jgi:two-component system, sensor histidine kinase and response regulator